MKTFYIFDNFFLPTPYNHRFFVEKFARGFGYSGFDVKIVKRIKDIKEPGFVMLSTHPFFYSFGNRCRNRNILLLPSLVLCKVFPFLKKLLLASHKILIRKLSKSLKGKEIAIIAWFWFREEKFFNGLGVPVIFTGEYFYGVPEIDYHKAWREFYMSRGNAIPIIFSADVDPKNIGNGCTNDLYDVAFVGNKGYKSDWYSIFKNREHSAIFPTPPFIGESERLDIYKKSKIVLGFHAKDNIRNKVVVERVFESLAYGAVCLADTPYAVEATDNCAVFVGSKEELERVTDDYLSDNEMVRKKREAGFRFAREKGTYYRQAMKFINAYNSLF